MSSSVTSIIFYILSFSLLTGTIIGDDPDHLCSPSGGSTIAYQTKTNMVIAALYDNVHPTGFGGGLETGEDQDLAEGYGLCRGDVSTDVCEACIFAAGQTIRQLCPTSRTRLIYYDQCFVIHSDTNILGTIDTNPYICLTSGVPVSDPTSFNEKVDYLLRQIAGFANNDPKLYYYGVMDLDPTNKVYAYVQCTMNIGNYCKSCLENIIGQLFQVCWNGQNGARLVAGSCIVRYEMFDFI